MLEALKASDQVTLVDRIAPVSQGAGTVTGAWVSAAAFNQYLAYVQGGVLGAAATVDAKFEQATTVGGAGAKDVTGSASTQMVKATDDGKFVLINLDPNKLDVDGGFAFIRVSVTVGAAASLIAVALLGINPRYGIPSHNAALKAVTTT